jgi:hypothetical protein
MEREAETFTEAEQDFFTQVTNRLSDAERNVVISQVVEILAEVEAQVSSGIDPAAIVFMNGPNAHPLSRLVAAEILRKRGRAGIFASQDP